METKIAEMDKYPSAPVKMTLDPDWDVLSALYRELQGFPKRPELSWIKSYQDETKKELEIEAEINVQADELATIGLQ